MKKALKPISIFALALFLVFSSFIQESVYADEITNAETKTEETVEHTANIDKTLKLNYTDCTLYFKQAKKYSSDKKLTDYSTKIKLRVFNNTSSVVVFSSTNKKVATVTTDGIVAPVGIGDCIIKAKVGKKTLTCNIKVENMPSAKTALKKVTATCKLVDKKVIVTVKNELALPVYVTVDYVGYTASGSKSSGGSKNIIVLPGKTTKEMEKIYDDSVVKIEKTATIITVEGSSYILASDGDEKFGYFYLSDLMSEVDTAEFYMDSVETVQDWGDDYLKFNYTVVNNEPYEIIGNVYIVFYKEKKIIWFEKVIDDRSFLPISYQPGVYQDSFKLPSFEYDNYKIVTNGFYQYIK